LTKVCATRLRPRSDLASAGAEVALAPHARGAQLVDRQPRRHGGRERGRRFDLLTSLERLMHPQQRLLHHVLGFGDAAEHPVGDRERDRPQLVEQSLAIGHLASGLTRPGPSRRSGQPTRR